MCCSFTSGVMLGKLTDYAEPFKAICLLD